MALMIKVGLGTVGLRQSVEERAWGGSAGVSHRSHFRRKHLKPLLETGLVRMTNPGNPRAPNQRYVLTDAGAALKGSG